VTATAHFGEEPVIAGSRGSGTVFCARCNLGCRFCQNHAISQPDERDHRRHVRTVDELAETFLELQEQGCHNLNWVTPTPQVPQLVAALGRAVERGFRLPVVYNTSAFDSPVVLALLEGIVDVWLPDLKYADAATALELSRAPAYPRVARAAIAEMYRQVGETWELDGEGMLRRGLVIRLLVLPNDLADVGESLAWIAHELSPRVGVSLMAQYYPTHRASVAEHPLLARTVAPGEWARAIELLEHHLEGGHHFVQELTAAPAYYQPDFTNPDEPFADRRDFATGHGSKSGAP